MKDHIILSVKKGSKIVGPNGSVIVLNEVTDDALDLIEAGASYLMLKESAKEPLKKLSEEKLTKLIEMRKSQKLTRDVAILEMALAEKKSGKMKDPDLTNNTNPKNQNNEPK